MRSANRHFGSLLLILCVSLLTVQTALCARMQEEFKRAFTFGGNPAKALIREFALDPKTKPEVEFWVNQGWTCDGEHAGPASCAERPARRNTLRLASPFKPDQPEVVLEGVFFDAFSGSGRKMPQYTACTKVQDLSSLEGSAWKPFLNKFDSKQSPSILFTTAIGDAPLFQIFAWPPGDRLPKIISICMGFDEASAEMRSQRLADYEACIRKNYSLDGGC